VQVLRSALMLRRAVGRGRFSVTCQAVEIGHQGSVSFKFSQAFHQLIANRKCVRARGRACAIKKPDVLETEQGAQNERPFDRRCFGRRANARNRGGRGRCCLGLHQRRLQRFTCSVSVGFRHSDQRPLAGGQIGYNWQSGWMLFGLEADGSWSNITGHGLCNTTTFFMNCSSKVEGLATFTGRVGASIDRALVYFKGGGAWGRESETISNVAQAPLATAFSSQLSVNRYGWTIGMGVEYAFLPNWSAKVEYDFIDFGTKLYNFPVTSTAVSASNFANWNFTAMVHEMKLGVNYHF
jgi:opacity protein-like surface antigen